jgi:dienelactone hydrolase
MEEMPFSSAEILNREYPSHVPRLTFPGGDREVWRRWRRRLLPALKKVFGPFPSLDGPLNVRVIEKERADPAFVQYKLVYEARPGVPVPAYLLIPTHGPARKPGVVCVHGHVPGGKESVVVPAEGLGVAYGAELARMGAVTLCPDNAGMGERAHPEGGCDFLWRRLNLLGWDLTGYRVYDLRRAVDVLRERPEVDGNRIGSAGLSGGCWLALVQAAFNPRIRASVLSGYFTTFAQTSWVGHCICHHPKGIGAVCEMPDIAGLIAPRPAFVEWGTQDTARPVHPAFEQARAIYEAAGAGDKLFLHEFDGGHLFCGERSLPWLMEALAAGGRNSGGRNTTD